MAKGSGPLAGVVSEGDVVLCPGWIDPVRRASMTHGSGANLRGPLVPVGIAISIPAFIPNAKCHISGWTGESLEPVGCDSSHSSVKLQLNDIVSQCVITG